MRKLVAVAFLLALASLVACAFTRSIVGEDPALKNATPQIIATIQADTQAHPENKAKNDVAVAALTTAATTDVDARIAALAADIKTLKDVNSSVPSPWQAPVGGALSLAAIIVGALAHRKAGANEDRIDGHDDQIAALNVPPAKPVA